MPSTYPLRFFSVPAEIWLMYTAGDSPVVTIKLLGGGRKIIAGVPGKRSSVQIEYPEDVPGAHNALLSEMKIHKNLRFWVMRFVLQPRFYSACSMPPSMRYTRPLVLRNRSGSQAVTMVWRCSIRLSR